jgi:hypothetical protein
VDSELSESSDVEEGKGGGEAEDHLSGVGKGSSLIGSLSIAIAPTPSGPSAVSAASVGSW